MRPEPPPLVRQSDGFLCPRCGSTFKLPPEISRVFPSPQVGHGCAPAEYIIDFVRSKGPPRRTLALPPPESWSETEPACFAQGWKAITGVRSMGHAELKWAVGAYRRGPIVRAMLRRHIPCFRYGDVIATREWLADLIIDAHSHGWSDEITKHIAKVLIPIWVKNHQDPVTRWWQDNWP